MRILVTGGAGYIGSHICAHLLRSGHEVVVLDDLSTGSEEALPTQVEFHRGDIRDGDFLNSLSTARPIEAVIHCAAKLIIADSFSQADEYYDVNVGGLISLLKFCRRRKIQKLVFSSSSSIYGNASPKSLIDESCASDPLSPYSSSKHIGEKILKDFERNYGLNSVSLRYFNAAGASDCGTNGQRGRATHIVKVCAEAGAGKRDFVPVNGDDYPTPDGTCVRDYIHIEDLAEVHCLALEHLLKGNKGDVFNVGYGRGFSVMEIVQVMRKISGVNFATRLQDRRPGDAASLIADTTKVRSALGWAPKRDSIENICASALKWEKLTKKTY
jgi:UDP-glucose 4-epimerase